jgi:hypothetical protein
VITVRTRLILLRPLQSRRLILLRPLQSRRLILRLLRLILRLCNKS